MSRDIERSARAQRDLDEAAFHLAGVDESLADGFIAAAEREFRRIAEMPGVGRLVAPANPQLPGLRRVPIRGFKKYGIYYIHDDTLIEVVRVLHSSRDIPTILGRER